MQVSIEYAVMTKYLEPKTVIKDGRLLQWNTNPFIVYNLASDEKMVAVYHRAGFDMGLDTYPFAIAFYVTFEDLQMFEAEYKSGNFVSKRLYAYKNNSDESQINPLQE